MRRVRLELALLREVDEQGHAVVCESADVVCCLVGREAHGCRPAISRPGSITVGGRTSRSLPITPSGWNVSRGSGARADSEGMAPPETTIELRDRALVLANELGVDPGSWYVRVLEEERKAGLEPDIGALVRAYWELQRVTGRADLRDTWRLLADQLWSGEAA